APIYHAARSGFPPIGGIPAGVIAKQDCLLRCAVVGGSPSHPRGLDQPARFARNRAAAETSAPTAAPITRRSNGAAIGTKWRNVPTVTAPTKANLATSS